MALEIHLREQGINSNTIRHSMPIGVYFSANDVVYDWAIAFLNSYRTFNPDLRLLLIPFNDQCDRLLKLQSTYNFEIFTDPSFERLEAIGHAFELGHSPTGPYWFRRYAAFWGPCDRFAYFDARQVILADLKPAIAALDDYDFDLLHFDCALDQVYEPGELRRSLLREGKARGFLSGLWIARRGLFDLAEFELLAAEALKVRDQLNPRNTDQAFINYCCDVKSVCYAHLADVLGGMCQNAWANQSGSLYNQSDRYYLWNYGGLNHQKQLLLMHWAGIGREGVMPKRSLFNHFFLLDQSWNCALKFYLQELLLSPVRTISRIKRIRLINQVYHKKMLLQRDLP